MQTQPARIAGVKPSQCSKRTVLRHGCRSTPDRPLVRPIQATTSERSQQQQEEKPAQTVASSSISPVHNPTGLNVGKNRPTSPKGWELMSKALKDAKVRVLSPQEVIFAQERGAVVIDIRPAHQYDKGHVPNAVNVPFYQPISGWSPWQVARRLGYAALGTLNGTEVNPKFEEEVSAAALPADGAILYCSMGGSLEATDSHPFGMQTRSLIACYTLIQKGYNHMAVMRGGFGEWENSGRTIEVIEEVEEEVSDASA